MDVLVTQKPSSLLRDPFVGSSFSVQSLFDNVGNFQASSSVPAQQTKSCAPNPVSTPNKSGNKQRKKAKSPAKGGTKGSSGQVSSQDEQKAAESQKNGPTGGLSYSSHTPNVRSIPPPVELLNR